jgi:protein arginine kinase activator
MMCQSCGKRKATVHLTEIDDAKHKRELHLCERCANSEESESFDLMGLLSGAFAAEPGTGEASPAKLQCDACGLAYMEFRGRGRLGCSECYEVFGPQLDPLLEKIHGKKRHVGKAPGDGPSEDRSRERRLVELRRKLQEAVGREDYEAAASLRDELRVYEEGGAESDAADD